MNEKAPTSLRTILHGPLDGGCGHWAPLVSPEIAAPIAARELAVVPMESRASDTTGASGKLIKRQPA